MKQITVGRQKKKNTNPCEEGIVSAKVILVAYYV